MKSLINPVDCDACDGSGETIHNDEGSFGDPINDYAKPCTTCDGTGQMEAPELDEYPDCVWRHAETPFASNH